MKMVIGLTDPMSSPAKSRNYPAWLIRWIPGAEIRILSHEHTSGDPCEGLDGIVLSGGVDVNPALYGMPEAAEITEKPNMERDAFESTLIARAIDRNLPLLGICRGMQLTNVVLGGTLVPDIERAGYASHSSTKEGDRHHEVIVEPGTRLASIVGVARGEVNSSHHQVVDRPGEGLRIAARSADGLIEALEWAEPDKRAFFQLVQWHPERMRAAEHPLTRLLVLRFAGALQRHITYEDHT